LTHNRKTKDNKLEVSNSKNSKKNKFTSLKRKLKIAGVLFILVTIPVTAYLSTQSEKVDTDTKISAAGTRDPYKHPFASNSPWNMPIGSAAQYAPSNLGQPSCYETSCRYFTEKEYIFLDRDAPLRTHQPGGGGSCGGGSSDGQVRIPDGVTFGGGSSNDTGGALRSDNITIQEWYKGCRSSGTGTLYSYGDYFCSHSILGNGIPGWCGHGGSGLSAIGGSIRTWELAPGTPIRHVLKLTLPANRLNNDIDSSQCNDGFRWPAVIADNGWNSPGGNSEYSGTTKSLCMGSLLALPQSTSCTSVVSNDLSRRVCQALRDYGAYVVDIHPLDGDCHSCWQPFTLNGESPVESALNDNDMITLISSLQVITNNSSSTVGGGGTPLVPMIEDICPTLPCSTSSDTEVPTASLTAPANGATVSGTSVNFSADASDNVGVTSVQFFVDGQSVNTDTSSPYSFSWNSTTKANGTYQIFARAYDAAGNQGNSTTRSITVNNISSPSVTLTLRGDPSVGPYSVIATTTLSGDIKMVFREGSTVLRTENDPPYELFGDGVTQQRQTIKTVGLSLIALGIVMIMALLYFLRHRKLHQIRNSI
jgi:hypothetical protein